MFTTKKLELFGLEAQGKWWNQHTQSYKKTFFAGQFALCLTKQGNVSVYDDNGTLLKIIKDENILVSFLTFARS